MEESTGTFIDKLQNALNEKLIFINNVAVKNIKTSIPEYREALSTLINSLYNSNLIEKDLYKSSQTVYELKIPPKDPIDPEKKEAEFSFRMYDYLRQFDCFGNNYDFSPQNISMEQVTDLKGFFSFIKWTGLSTASSNPVERILAEIELTVKSGDNSILIGIFRDCRTRLSESANIIFSALEDLDVYIREQYKLEVRKNLPSITAMDAQQAVHKPDETLFAIKNLIKTEKGEIPFYSKLIKEIIDEEYAADSDQRKTETIRRISSNSSTVKNEKEEKPSDEEADQKGLLLEGIKLLSACGSSLVDVASKLEHNADIIEKVNRGLFFRILGFLTGRKKTAGNRVYSIVVFNSDDETGRKIQVDLVKLTENLSSTGYRLILLGNKNSKSYLNLLQCPETKLEEILTGYLKRIVVFISKLPALDIYMKENSTNAMRAEMKGFKLDLNDIQSCLNKANKRRLEYKGA